MSILEEECADLLGLPQVANRLGLHRATVNEMVREGRLSATRIGPHWFVRRSDLDVFAARYQRPKNSPKRGAVGERSERIRAILCQLADWETATSDELARVIDLHPGNVRKYLVFCEQDGMATRDDYGNWRITDEGRATLARMAAAVDLPGNGSSRHM